MAAILRRWLGVVLVPYNLAIFTCRRRHTIARGKGPERRTQRACKHDTGAVSAAVYSWATDPSSSDRVLAARTQGLRARCQHPELSEKTERAARPSSCAIAPRSLSSGACPAVARARGLGARCTPPRDAHATRFAECGHGGAARGLACRSLRRGRGPDAGPPDAPVVDDQFASPLCACSTGAAIKCVCGRGAGMPATLLTCDSSLPPWRFVQSGSRQTLFDTSSSTLTAGRISTGVRSSIDYFTSLPSRFFGTHWMCA